MKQRNLILFVLLALVGLVANAHAQSATVLLQEGIYAEQTEGDLDKAIKIYNQVLEKYNNVERLAARATYQLGMCHLKKGEKDKAAEYFQEAVDYYPTQSSVVKKAQKQLENIKPEPKDSVFEQVDYHILRFLGNKFGETATEAGQQSIGVNSHLYYVDQDGFSYRGGLNSYYNWTGQTITDKVSFGGTSYPNQTLYDITGQELNTQIVPHKTRPNHWQVYWIPDEPLAPGEYFPYGWSLNEKKKLPQLPGDVYSLTMQNQYGMKVIETFFLVLPEGVSISQSNPPTGNKEFDDSNVYWWTKTVKQGKNHIEKVLLDIDEIKVYPEELKPVAVDSFPKTYSNDVDPDIKEISVTFDQDMFQYGYAWCQSGSDETFPKSTGGGNAHYIDSRTCVLPVDVEPGKAYSVFVNLGKFQAFRNTDEIPAREFVIVFATKDTDGNPTEIPEHMLQRARQTNDKIPDPVTPEQIVEKAVKTISTCAEGDARVAPAIATIKSLDESVAINELKKYLASENNEIRRSAVYVLYMGKFENIDAAIADLEKLCSHAESMTRGMAALALGENKIQSSFEILKEMTLNDKSGFARRCAAYALGMLGDTKAIPILQQAIEDPDKLVQNNAGAALIMLEK